MTKPKLTEKECQKRDWLEVKKYYRLDRSIFRALKGGKYPMPRPKQTEVDGFPSYQEWERCDIITDLWLKGRDVS
jgi:hypothetical protein